MFISWPRQGQIHVMSYKTFSLVNHVKVKYRSCHTKHFHWLTTSRSYTGHVIQNIFIGLTSRSYTGHVIQNIFIGWPRQGHIQVMSYKTFSLVWRQGHIQVMSYKTFSLVWRQGHIQVMSYKTFSLVDHVKVIYRSCHTDDLIYIFVGIIWLPYFGPCKNLCIVVRKITF
jgi:hypothetical protein